MLQKEFETRVRVSVSNKEFEAIHEVYLNSDYDKDEFCKLWVKMNYKRIRKFMAEAKIKERTAVVRGKAWDIINIYNVSNMYGKPASSILTKSQQDFCKSIGIVILDIDYNPYSFTTIDTVVWELMKLLRVE